MRRRLAIAVLFASWAFAVPGAGTAQDAHGVPPSILDILTPGDRVIAQALFEAQVIEAARVAKAGPRWALRRIAVARAAGQGWGEIFAAMKADGLLTAVDLGEIVERYQPPPSLLPVAPRPPARPVVITTGMNQVTLVPAPRRYIEWDFGPAAPARPAVAANEDAVMKIK